MDQPNSNSSQQQKQQRRRRKDPQSRDFFCRCGKSYLSYAAAYTHVKNKHNGEGDYLNNISRPNREKLKRGRPKQKKAFSITEETQKLSVIEQAILYIYEAMQKDGDPNKKIILEGNQQLKQEQIIKSYGQLTQQFGTPALTLHLPQIKILNKNLHQFIQNMNKHFVSQIAAKIIWVVNYVLGEDEVSIVDKLNMVKEQNSEQKQIEIDGYRMRERANDNICLSIWGQGESISEIVITALEKWMMAVRKNQQNIQIHD